MSQENTGQKFEVLDDFSIKMLIFCKKNNKINDAITNGPSEISSIVNNSIIISEIDTIFYLYKLGEHKNWHAGGELQKLISEKFGDDSVRDISYIYQTHYIVKNQYGTALREYDGYSDYYDRYGDYYDGEGYDVEVHNENGYDDYEGYDVEG